MKKLSVRIFLTLLRINPPYHLKYWKMLRLLLLAALDAGLVYIGFFAALFLRVDSFWHGDYVATIQQYLPVLFFTHVPVFLFCGMYRQVWRYANLNSVFIITRAVFLASLISTATYYLSMNSNMPRSVFILHGLMSFLLIATSRFFWRSWTAAQSKFYGKNRPRCLIYGAGAAGTLLAQHIDSSPNFPFKAVGFIDDDPNKQGRQLHGLRIYGNLATLKEISQKKGVSTIIIALHSAPGKVVRNIVGSCQELNLKTLIMPDISTGLMENVFQPRPVAIKDLLKRPDIHLDTPMVKEFVAGKAILVTGAGGSIGSEICRQIHKLNPAHLIMVDSTEYNLFAIHTELGDVESRDVQLTPVLGSVTNEALVKSTLAKHKPSIILHAAAYKHVPLLESNANASIVNNLQGTLTMARAAIEFETKKFVLISSDKAVNPTSVMGTTKRCCELLVNCLSSQTEKTKFCTVRFGNVLGSSGSVVPRFLTQIRKGGPITVTHPEVTRYFMLTSEAVGLVLQSAATSKGGEIFILDMGSPINILEMAKQLISLSGKNPGRDIEIEITGLRPGEKLFEELIIKGAEHHTLLKGVYLAKPQPIDSFSTISEIENIIAEAAHFSDKSEAVRLLRELVKRESRSDKDSRQETRKEEQLTVH